MIRTRKWPSEFEAKRFGAECKFDFASFLMATVPGVKAFKRMLTLSSFPLDVFWYFHSYPLYSLNTPVFNIINEKRLAVCLMSKPHRFYQGHQNGRLLAADTQIRLIGPVETAPVRRMNRKNALSCGA